MNIDWFVLISQMVNFLILVALLKHFLYNRIVKVMDEREQLIASRLDEAEAKKNEADEELEEYQQKKQELENKKDELLEQAKQKSEEEKKELIQKARKEVEELRSRWKKTVEQEQDEFYSELRQKVGDQVYSISRRVLKDLSDVNLEKQIIAEFIERIQNMNDDEKEEIVNFVKKNDDNIQINSAFELSDDLKEKITGALKEKVTKQVALNFGITEDLICGIEMKLDGKKVVWSIDNYLSTLEESFNQAIREDIKDSETEKKDNSDKDK